MNGENTIDPRLADSPPEDRGPWRLHARALRQRPAGRGALGSWAWPLGLGCGVLLWIVLVWNVGATTL